MREGLNRIGSIPERKMKPKSPQAPPILHCAQQADWFAWLEDHHATSPGVWLKLARKGSDARSLTYDEAIEAALCFGWIDGQKQAQDAQFWRQKFTRRTNKSIWSKINKAKALALVEAGRMKPAGLSEMARAKHDGRWDAAYDSAGTATVPADFQSALDRRPRALAFFQTLDARNRYALLFRIQTAKKAETRAARIAKFVHMLEQHEKLHP